MADRRTTFTTGIATSRCAMPAAALLLAAAPLPRLAAQASVVGTVRDSLGGSPLAGATVQLVPQGAPASPGRLASADSVGRFRVSGVAPGRYLLGFMHPRLDSLGLEVPARVIEVAAESPAAEVRADLAVPSARTLARALCGPRRDDDSAAGVLIGRVLDAADGAPAAAGEVHVRWGEVRVDARGVRRVLQGVRTPVGEGGRYAACGVPTDAPVLVQARTEARTGTRDAGAAGATSGAIEVALAAAAPLGHRDLFVAPVAAGADGAASTGPGGPIHGAIAGPLRRTAWLVGRVRRPDGRPLEGARVMVRGLDVGDSAAVTGADGQYRLGGLPGGTHPVEVIALGYAPARGAADLRPGAGATFDVTLATQVPTLQTVSAYAAAPRATSEFARRRRQGFGRFLTSEDLVRRNAVFLGYALTGMPGLRLTGATVDGRPVLGGRFDCAPTFFLDGMYVEGGSAELDSWVRSGDVGGVEVYATALEAPVQYRDPKRSADCATVLVWTKGSLR